MLRSGEYCYPTLRFKTVRERLHSYGSSQTVMQKYAARLSLHVSIYTELPESLASCKILLCRNIWWGPTSILLEFLHSYFVPIFH